MGPQNSMGHGVITPPCPPLMGPVAENKRQENRKTVFEITATQPIFAFVPIHLKGKELFSFIPSSSVTTVGGPSFVYNLKFESIIQY